MIQDYLDNFKQNKYMKWYCDLIISRQNSHRKKSRDIYYENHHILPKCLYPDLTKEKNNLVLLTPKEHFIAHLLLVKIVKTRDAEIKMSTALRKIMTDKRNGSRIYETKKYTTKL